MKWIFKIFIYAIIKNNKSIKNNLTKNVTKNYIILDNFLQDKIKSIDKI